MTSSDLKTKYIDLYEPFAYFLTLKRTTKKGPRLKEDSGPFFDHNQHKGGANTDRA